MLFASYSRVDRALVEPLLADLHALGHDVWLDEEMSGGTVWWEEILARIRACQAFLFLTTPSSIESEACLLELGYAQATARPVIPVELAPTAPATLPTSLAAHQIIRYAPADRMAPIALARALSRLEERPLPDPLPPAPPLPGSYVASLRDQIGSSAPLTLDQQLGLVHRIRARIDDDDDDSAAELGPLLERLRARDDLYAAVATQVDELRKALAARPRPGRPARLHRWRRPVGAERVGVAISAGAGLIALAAMFGALYRSPGGSVSWDQYDWTVQRWQLIALVAVLVVLVAVSFRTAGRARRAALGGSVLVVLFGLLWWWEMVDDLLRQTYISESSVAVESGLAATGVALVLQLVAVVTLLAAASVD